MVPYTNVPAPCWYAAPLRLPGNTVSVSSAIEDYHVLISVTELEVAEWDVFGRWERKTQVDRNREPGAHSA